MFIRQLIINLLVLNIVFSNFAWAIDECAYDFSNSNSTEFLMTVDQLSNHQLSNHSQTCNDQKVDKDADINGSSNVSCDNHCFANVQLIYVAFHLNDIQFLNNYSNINSRQVPWHSINAQPPVKPPKV